MENRTKKKIAVLYIGTGRYTIFWKDFYKSAEKFFLPNSEKHYYFFTDSEDFHSVGKVTVLEQQNLGWPMIACFRYKILNRLKEELKNYDYAFFFNGNMEFIGEVTEEEFLPTDEEGIVAPLHSMNKKNKKMSNKEFPYERNPKSTSYIPYGLGKKYYHSGILGGKIAPFLELLESCQKMMEEDFKNGIIPVVHDESTFNKYILDKNCKELSNNYIFSPRRKPFYRLNKNIKIIQRDKSKLKYGGHKYLRNETDVKKSFFDFIFGGFLCKK